MKRKLQESRMTLTKLSRVLSLLFLATITLGANGGGCASVGGGSRAERVDVEATDREVFFPTFRASYQLLPSSETLPGKTPKGFDRESEQPPATILPTASLDLDLSYGDGDSSQNLTSSEFIDFDGTRFDGPARVGVDYDLTMASLATRGGMLLVEQVSLEGLLGVGVQHLDLTLRSGPSSERDIRTNPGALIGARLTWQPLSWLSFYGQSSALLGEARSTSSELGAGLTPVNHLTFFGGWRWMRYEENVRGSDLDSLKLSGPVAGIQMSF